MIVKTSFSDAVNAFDCSTITLRKFGITPRQTKNSERPGPGKAFFQHGEINAAIDKKCGSESMMYYGISQMFFCKLPFSSDKRLITGVNGT